MCDPVNEYKDRDPELTKEETALVYGAGDGAEGNPFEDEPRVPVAPIDPSIREDA